MPRSEPVMSWKERPKRPMFCIPLSVHENTEDEEGKTVSTPNSEGLGSRHHVTYHVRNNDIRTARSRFITEPRDKLPPLNS